VSAFINFSCEMDAEGDCRKKNTRTFRNASWFYRDYDKFMWRMLFMERMIDNGSGITIARDIRSEMYESEDYGEDPGLLADKISPPDSMQEDGWTFCAG